MAKQENVIVIKTEENLVEETSFRKILTNDPTAIPNYTTIDYDSLTAQEKSTIDAYVALMESKIV